MSSTVNFNQFLHCIITEGIDAAKKDYITFEDQEKLKGSIAGFELCRQKTINEILEVQKIVYVEMERAYRDKALNYWFYVCQWSEVDWVINCCKGYEILSDNDKFLKFNISSFYPTARGLTKAIDVYARLKVDYLKNKPVLSNA